jgi:mitosis inhibitor protein kinase SWE1
VTDDADVDVFILCTLMAATKGPKERRGSGGAYGMKKRPGTPVKKVKTNHNLRGDRPWQSVVAAKVGGSRKSMPAVYPCESRSDTDSQGEEESPSSRKEARYEGLGLDHV